MLNKPSKWYQAVMAGVRAYHRLTAPPVVTRIPVRPGNLGTLNGYSLRIPVRVIKRHKIEVKYDAKDN